MNKTVGLGVSLLLLASCTDKVGEEVNGMATDGYSVMLRHDFEYEDGTRVSLTRKDKGVSCVWEEGDEIGVFPIAPESGTQSRMTIKKNDNYKDAHYAEFSGGGWKLNPQNTYAAYYPYNASLASDANHTSVRIDLSGQKQTGNGSMAHLSKYDYMYAPSTFAVEKDEYGWEHVVAFDFHHAVSIMELKLKVPVAATW
ncbi:MAG: fimbrillin family protein, partial [Bacteroidaceae bacterium]|nr:fimbrillin family protein [Bacteroidaceae bacterium]